jgi:ATP-dependent Zn protease
MTAQACGLPLIESSVAELFAISSGYLDGVIKAQRALFARAAAAAPCILFLDELDAMPNRATISPRGKDWWLPVINDFLLLLASTPPGVITIGATNRIEDIDEAILRPGRLERAIEIKSPSTAEGLAGILRFQLGPDLARTDLLPLARFGVGATAAVAMEWVRSARRSARTAKREMIAADLLAAIAPPDGRGPEVLRMAATHEAGHAVAMLALGVGSVESISLIPDGSSNGRLTPGAGVDMSLYGRDEIEKFATMLLSGRAAEVILLGRATVGAGGDPQSDLARATRLVASVHSSFGLGEFATYRDAADKAGASLEYDLALRALVERELQRLQDAARGLMARYRDAVQAIAEALLARRFLDGAEIQALFAAASKSPRIRATSSGDVAKLDDAADGAAATSEAPEPTARAASKKGGRP